ncbi:MAG: TetR/AcrR family transcriptional regulator [Treponema sp.]|nr:TetR/AcrR family transcriptional regulator [Treponema sp.]
MSRKNISQEKIIQSFLASAFEKSAGATSLADVSDSLEIKKASLYNHFESKENMYASTLELCGKEINLVSFLSDKTIDSIKNGKTTLPALLKRLINRYFNLFETEPLFQMYVFVRTEQYFNLEALKIIRTENEKLTDEIRKILQAFMDIEKIQACSEKELREKASAISSIILQQRDFYIANRKEIVRQNPESGAGTLFALPTDDEAISKAYKMVEFTLKAL